jgi:hypothetical protein
VLTYDVGIYLTDGTFLYRVDEVVATDAGDVADLEDCYHLGVVRVPLDDLRARRLRLVTPDVAEVVGAGAPAVSAR